MLNAERDYKLVLRLSVGKILRSRNVAAFLAKLPENSSILDVGCGNNSPYSIKNMYPLMHYTGIDIADYNQTKPLLADRYFLCTPDEFDAEIAKHQSCFDAIISAHNLEHCNDRGKVLEAMLCALKPGGALFLSFPCEESIHFPKRRGTLNYYDDPTHKERPPNFSSIIHALESYGCDVLFQSPRYRPLFFWATGLLVEPLSRLTRRIYSGTWDLYGFQSIIWARKRISSVFRPIT